MNLQSQISSYLIGVGEFVVVVPFVKKDRHRVEASETPSEDPNHNERLETESAWSELMQDLSSLRDCEKLAENELKSVDSVNENSFDRSTSSRTMKRKKVLNKDKERPSYAALLSMLHTTGEDMFDEHNIKKFLQFIDSSCCLSDPATGSCVMREASELDPCKNSLCQCPLWLKDIMRAFSFINVYSACLQLWHREINITALKKPLDQLHKHGLHTGTADLEVISQLCPQVIHPIAESVLLRFRLPQFSCRVVYLLNQR